MNRRGVVTSADVALLRALGESRSLAAAGRAVGMSRDRAVYRIGRLTRAFGGRVVASTRGGPDHGATVLTPLGDRIVRGGFDSVELLEARPIAPIERPNLLRGVYRRDPMPEVRVGALRLRVAFEAPDGSPVAVLLDPEAIVVARRRFASSARNVLTGTIAAVRRRRSGRALELTVRCSGTPIRVAITDEPVRQLGLAPGVRVRLYVKATALRRVGRPSGPAGR